MLVYQRGKDVDESLGCFEHHVGIAKKKKRTNQALVSHQKKPSIESWLFNTVDGKNPKQPPGMHKNL